jgi:hypothetical protein
MSAMGSFKRQPLASVKAPVWTFRSQFRAGAFGWRSDLPIKRIKEAVAEIKKAARKDKVLGAEGAVIFLEKVSGALAHVDSSSGAIGTAVNRAIETLAPIVSQAPASDDVRDKWLERLWRAIEDDEIPYIELLPDHWGELCVTPERASRWADRLIEVVRLTWSPDLPRGGVFKGTTACLSALFSAGRHEELLNLLDLAPYKFWPDRRWGVQALIAQGQTAAAIRYAEDTRGLNQPDSRISGACEEILRAEGQWREAYDRYAIEANRHSTYLATFQAITSKYPQIEPKTVLGDLVSRASGDEGKWFAAAKSAGLLTEAAELAQRYPCDPKTLTRATRDFAASNPEFARAVGLAALKWLLRGYGYDLTTLDVVTALEHTLEAARNDGSEADALCEIRRLVDQHQGADHSTVALLRRKLEESAPKEGEFCRG